jgi:hypothetical protein
VRQIGSTTELSPGSIPDHLRQAFRNAVWSYAGWNPTLPEPEVHVAESHVAEGHVTDGHVTDGHVTDVAGSAYPISAVCGLVGEFQDRLPEDIFDRLMSYMREIRYTLLRQKLVAEHSYAAGSRCFLRLIEDRKRHFLVP